MNRPAPLLRQDNTAIVELNDVWARYNEKWVLKSIFLACYPGEILGIVGPNGSGKTTLLNVIMGLIPPEKGTVRLFGREPDKASRLEVGYLPQISQADRSFPVTVLDVVLMGLYGRLGLFRRPNRKSIETAMEQLHQVNMADHAQRPFGILSGGQQQRVHIARALASRPRLLILDEPATGIDSVAQEDFYELLAKFRDEQGISAILVSHDIGVITSHADHVACLNREIHYHGEPEFCLSSEIQRKVFGDHMKVMVHDPACVSCSKRHQNDS
ncbi:MAG: metal ABC transporter ATP-binding protein [Thermodesulfobacteriota bacterium]